MHSTGYGRLLPDEVLLANASIDDDCVENEAADARVDPGEGGPVSSGSTSSQGPSRNGHISVNYNMTGFQRAKYYEIANKESADYRRIDLMYKLMRICNTLKIPDHERIYSLFLKRLKTRFRLEASTRSLEIVVAALYYIDECRRNFGRLSVRDVLSRIKDCGIGLKKFVGYVAKVCDELSIAELPSERYDTIVSNALDQLRDYLRGGEKDELMPKATTTVLGNVNRFASLDELVAMVANNPISDIPRDKSTSLEQGSIVPQAELGDSVPVDPMLPYHLSAQYHKLSQNNQSLQRGDEKGQSKKKGTLHRSLYRAVGIKFKSIEDMVCRILELIDDESGDILDPRSRAMYRCKKTLVASVLAIVIAALKINISPSVLVRALDVARSSFYRNYKRVLDLLRMLFAKRFSCKIINTQHLLSLVALFLVEHMNKLDTDKDGPLSFPKNFGAFTKAKYKGLMIESDFNINYGELLGKISRVNGRLDNSGNVMSTFSKTVNCLEFLTRAWHAGEKGDKGEVPAASNGESEKPRNTGDEEKRKPSKEKEERAETEQPKKKVYLIHERSNNRYVCRYRDEAGALRRKTFSIARHGQDVALRLASTFLESLSAS
ncbi:conserved hypothetical protein [Theileria equi strain WA]|uniref:Uncharacterized protein n=1 Tax=Theileria equi strain WA TaxID=1537102 RepID=L1LFB6_THEEQ|nr:conserved hypothetical protein [Theileria equi strain WA]EKX73838.1 conserved hypothetical protein [Theileria equi strain WA]|eukprot:XP_004833290.1 conserved hypothetical protein [Theileria equi strain WA]